MDFLTTADAEQGSLHDDIDAFFATLRRDGTLLSATYFGGSGKDEGLAIAVDQYGIGYAAGYTQSPNLAVGNRYRKRTGAMVTDSLPPSI